MHTHIKEGTCFNRLLRLFPTLALISVKCSTALALRKRGAEVLHPEKAKVTVYIGRIERKKKSRRERLKEKVLIPSFESLVLT